MTFTATGYYLIAAYNFTGPGNVNKALRKAGVETRPSGIWALFCQERPRSYVPIFICSYLYFRIPQKHNIPPAEFTYHYDMVDTVMVTRKMTLDQIGPYVA